MNIKEAKELLEILEDSYPDTDLRISLDKIEAALVLKAANFHVVLEANVWRPMELTVPMKSI